MKKNIKKYLVVATIVALPLASISYAHTRTHETERRELIQFIDYCRTCGNLRQVDPSKDYTKASHHELKSAARFYEEQPDFADCTDYERQEQVDNIIK